MAVIKEEKNDSQNNAVILLPALPASFAHNFVSEMQRFFFQRVPGCNRIADLSLK